MSLFSRTALRESALGPLLLIAVVYLATLATTGHGGFWITDNASKFLQLQAIVGSGYSDYSIPWGGAVLDPELRFNPLPAPFTHVVQGRLYSQYPPFF